MYKATANSSNVITFTGTPVEPSEVQIGLNGGWNWIGYTPQESMGINTALGSINGLATYMAKIKHHTQSIMILMDGGEPLK